MRFAIATILGIILLASLTSAQPTFQESGVNRAIDIEYSKIDVFERNESHEFFFYTFNSTDGSFLDNTTTNCQFNWFSPNGSELYQNNDLEQFNDNGWKITLNKGNFSQLGQHSFITKCNNTDGGGFISSSVRVTNTGNEFDSGEAIGASASLLGALALTFFFMNFGFRLSENPNMIPLGILFGGISLFLAIYSLFIGFTFSLDIAQYEALGSLTQIIFISVLWSIVGIVIITVSLMLIAIIKELSEVVEKRKFGEGWNPVTKSYDI